MESLEHYIVDLARTSVWFRRGSTIFGIHPSLSAAITSMRVSGIGCYISARVKQ